MPPSDPSPPKHTDLEILEPIYNQVYREFVNSTAGESNFVQFDLGAIAAQLDESEDILFGRMFHDLGMRYRHRREGRGGDVHLFIVRGGMLRVNVPYLASVVADLTDKREKYLTANTFSALSLGVAAVSLLISVL